MFTTVISSLTSLLPGSFIFSAYLPVLIFGFVNGAMFYVCDATFRSFVHAQIVAPFTPTTTVLFVASVAAAYTLSAFTDFLRELLEGKHLRQWLFDWLCTAQADDLLRADVRFDEKRMLADALNDAQRSQWADALETATADATTFVKDGFPGVPASPPGTSGSRRPKHDITTPSWERLGRTIRRNEPFTFIDIDGAVRQMVAALALRDHREHPSLVVGARRLIVTIDYARDLANEQEIWAYTRRHARFGLTIMPTRFGNVGAAIESYPATRYGIDLDTFWSRLAGILPPPSDKTSSALVNAKTQLDFLVVSTWLVAVTTIFWLVMLGTWGTSWLLFAAFALLGPAAFNGTLYIAKSSYLAYGMVVRATVDLHRFELLEALHLRRPNGIRAERRLWQGLRKLSSFGTSEIELSYDPEKEAKK